MSRKMRKKNEDFGDIDKYEDEDITDSDDQYSDSEKQILEKVRKKRVPEQFDSDDEVYGLHLDDNDEENDDGDDDDDEEDDDNDSMESDIDKPEEHDDMPDERAWGKKKSQYFSTDYVDQDYATTNERDRNKAELEENAARAIQQKIADQLDDADFGLDQFITTKDADENNDGLGKDDVVVKTDLNKLSKREKQILMQKESPEFQSLLDDAKDRLKELIETIHPFLKLVKTKDLPTTTAITFVQVKYQLVLNYLTNIVFYFTLKANKTPVANHPVIRRLAQYRQLLQQIEDGQGNLMETISEIVVADREGKTLYDVPVSGEVQPSVKKSVEKDDSLMSAVDYDDESDEVDEAEEDADEEAMQVDEDGQVEASEEAKRLITYQISKNKGLTPYRKKELRNPRVKHRNKYRKAVIRRKGAVRDVRKETRRYDGEVSGIKASVTKSIKLK